jgi:hypothetical protein
MAGVICPECETEYREGFTRCADCDVALVASLDEAGEATLDDSVLVPLTIESSSELVGTLLEAIESRQIGYVIQAGTAIPVLDGEEEPEAAPFPWIARIWVTPDKADEARELLEDIRARLRDALTGGPRDSFPVR